MFKSKKKNSLKKEKKTKSLYFVFVFKQMIKEMSLFSFLIYLFSFTYPFSYIMTSRRFLLSLLLGKENWGMNKERKVTKAFAIPTANIVEYGWVSLSRAGQDYK